MLPVPSLSLGMTALYSHNSRAFPKGWLLFRVSGFVLFMADGFELAKSGEVFMKQTSDSDGSVYRGGTAVQPWRGFSKQTVDSL